MGEPFERVLLVGLGGMLGSVARYELSGWAQRLTSAGFPVGTLAVNVAGSFLIGLVLSSSLDRGVPGPAARLFLTTGFCGGFTTMSTLSYETLVLVAEGGVLAAAANVIGTFVLCMMAVWIGVVIGRLA
jgi:CrcB protein